MTTISVRADVIESAGLSASDVAAWSQASPPKQASFQSATAAVSDFLSRGVTLLGRLPEPRRRSDVQRDAAAAIKEVLASVREDYLGAHVIELYERLTN